jgi:hypothetical protein
MLAGQKPLDHLLGDEFEIADTGKTFGIKVGHDETSKRRECRTTSNSLRHNG